MESGESLKQQVLREQRVINRLRQAQTRLNEAERERIWAIAAAHSAGLSIRKIAVAVNLSSSRVHQFLHTDEAHQIPDWLNALNEPDVSSDKQSASEESPSLTAWQQRLADEVEVLGWCIGWLEQLARGERVVINLRAASDSQTAYVAVDREWVLRVLKRVTADLDQMSCCFSPTEGGNEGEDPIAAGVKRRYRLAEPEPELSSLSQREQRAILREKLGLPHYER